MLSLLLDENISPVVAEEIKKKRPEIEINTLYSWQEGKFLGIGDELILIAEWGEAGISHEGLIFVDDKSIPSNNFGQIISSLIWLWNNYHSDNWQNRLIFFQPV